MSTQCQKLDILAMYGVPNMLDVIARKEKANLFSMLNPCFVLADSLNEIYNAGGFVVNIPKGLEDALKSGLAHLDKSNKNIGAFTPNIRLNGETGIRGQLTISEGVDSQAVTYSLSNLAMMAMLQGVLSKLDAIKEINEDILKGQENDRIGKIIGSFKAFKDLCALVDDASSDIVKIQGTTCYASMQVGLAQLLLQIDEERKKLEEMPCNHKQVFCRSLTSWGSVVKPKIYKKFAYNLQLYCRLLLLSDVLLLRIGKAEVIRQNHEVIDEYYSSLLKSGFREHMDFITNGHTAELDVINKFNQNCSNLFSAISQNGISLECTPDDIKLLKHKEHES